MAESALREASLRAARHGTTAVRELVALGFDKALYWALMSIAAWQALFQLQRRPSAWEKTRHGVARDRRTPRRSLRLRF